MLYVVYRATNDWRVTVTPAPLGAGVGREQAAPRKDRMETVELLKDEIEQLRVQLAGCGVAAMGATAKNVRAVQGTYGWSPAYEAVLKLRNKYEELLRDLDRRGEISGD